MPEIRCRKYGLKTQPKLDTRSSAVSTLKMLKLCIPYSVLALATCHVLWTDFKLVDTGYNFNQLGTSAVISSFTLEECAMNCIETDCRSISITRNNVCRLSRIYLKEKVNNQGVFEVDDGTRIFTRIGKLFLFLKCDDDCFSLSEITH